MAIHSSILAWETSWTEAQWATVHGVSKSWTHTIQRMSNNNNNFRRSITIIIAQQVSIHLQSRRPCFNSWVGKIHWRRDKLPTPISLGFPCGSAGKESTCNAGDLGETWVQSLGWEDPLEMGYCPLFLPGKSNRRRSLEGYSPQCSESDTTEQLHFYFHFTRHDRYQRKNTSQRRSPNNLHRSLLEPLDGY